MAIVPAATTAGDALQAHVGRAVEVNVELHLVEACAFEVEGVPFLLAIGACVLRRKESRVEDCLPIAEHGRLPVGRRRRRQRLRVLGQVEQGAHRLRL